MRKFDAKDLAFYAVGKL